MKPFRIPHPFFDPASPYNRLREASPADDRTIGYFSWLKKRRELSARLRPQVPESQTSPRQAAEAHLAMAAATGGQVVVQLDRPEADVRLQKFDRPDDSTLPDTRYWVTFKLASSENCPTGEVPCRVILLESVLLERLYRNLEKEGRQVDPNPVRAIRSLFSEQELTQNGAVTALLSALPELTGTINNKGEGKARFEGLPDVCPNTPDDTWFIIVYDSEREVAR